MLSLHWKSKLKTRLGTVKARLYVEEMFQMHERLALHTCKGAAGNPYAGSVVWQKCMSALHLHSSNVARESCMHGRRWPCMHAERHACMPLTGFLTASSFVDYAVMS